MSIQILHEITQLVDRYAQAGGRTATPIPSLSLTRSTSCNSTDQCPQAPVFGMVLQGLVSIGLGGKTQEIGLGDYLFVSFDVPVAFHTLEADMTEPCLAFSMEISPERLHEVLSRMEILPQSVAAQQEYGCILVDRANGKLLDATLRLLRLLDTPQDIPPLAPLIEQEIIYHLLCGPYGARLQQLAVSGSPANGVNKAIDWLRNHYVEPLSIPRLANQIGMSESSLHHHFKAITGLTPVQYQKQLRLYEARRLILVGGQSIGSAGFEVGYQSRSQFTREYKRFYGVAPRQHIQDKSLSEMD